MEEQAYAEGVMGHVWESLPCVEGVKYFVEGLVEVSSEGLACCLPTLT
jgi:hypothetical protein